MCLVLGGGNASSIGPLDTIHKLVVERQVVVLKLHPVMAHLAEVQEAALAPLVRAGVLRIVHGDAVQGAHLAHHPGVDTLHITGADRTYDAIVYGPGPDGAERRRRDEPVMTKPFTAELGNLTPIIVMPGRWSEGDLDYHADNIVTMLTNNAGFNCTTSRVIVTAAALAAARRAHGPDPPPPRRPADAPRVLPGRRGPLRGLRPTSTPTRSCSAARRTATSRGCSSRTSRPTPRVTRATASRRSAA